MDVTPASTPNVVIFDLDGTLVDSAPGILHAYASTLADLGIEADETTLRGLIGPPLEESFARLGVASDEINEVVARYRLYYDLDGVALATPYEGIIELLGQLRASSVTLALATSKRVDFARRMLDAMGVRGLFDAVVGASLNGRLTKKNDIVDQALRELDAPRDATTWMVGDRYLDIHAAQRHELTAVGVLWGYGSEAELADSGAELLVGSPEELWNLTHLSSR